MFKSLLKKLSESTVSVLPVTAIVLILLSLFPNSVVKLSEVLGFISPANLVFLCMIFLVLVKLCQVSIELSVQKHRLNHLVQKLALLNRQQEEMKETQMDPKIMDYEDKK